MTDRYDVVVLGAGPAGLMAARKLAQQGRSVVVLERAAAVGGMAGSFEIAGIRVDYGSHRLHRVLEPRLEAELAELLGDDLQRRPRRGRISLKGRWLAFPLRLGDLVQKLPKGLVARIGVDTLLGPFRKPKGEDAGSVIEARLGRTVARTFYTPYLRKLWDSPLEELSTELADRRVSARSGLSVVKKALAARKGEGGAYYLYPRPWLRADQRVRGRRRGGRWGRATSRGGGHIGRPGGTGRDRPSGRRFGGGGEHGALEHPGPGHRQARRCAARRARGGRPAAAPSHGPRLPGARRRPAHGLRRALLPRAVHAGEPHVGAEELP